MTKILAAGILAIDKNSGKILLVKRSNISTSPNVWVTVGGKKDYSDENMRKTAIREFKEEVQPDDPYELSKVPFFITENDFVKYYTYLGFFNNKFVPALNEENSEYGWFDLDSLPKELHPECKLLFKIKKEDLEKIIKKIIK